MCLWFQSSYCISCGSKIGENTKFSPYRCSVCFWLLFIRTFDRHRHRLYKHNDLSPEHFLDSIYRYDNWANWYHSEYYSVCPVGIFLPLLYKKYHHMKTVALTGFLFSLAVEIVQMFGWGSSDINDLMTNTAGACIGFLVYCLLSRILPANLKSNFNPAVSMLWLKYFSLLFAHLPLWSRLRLGLSMMCWMFHKLYRKQSVSDIKNSVFCLTHLQTDFSVLNLVASTKPLPMEFQSFPSCYAWTDWIILFVLYLLFLGNSPQRLLTWRYKK